MALDLPAEAVATIAAWTRDQLGECPGLRLVAPEDYHVTLCFLGSRPSGEVEAIAGACREAGSLPEVTLSLGEPVWLPARRPRAVALQLRDDTGDALNSLQRTLAGSLAVAGVYEPESRPFLAHVTVARVPARRRVGRAALAPPPAIRLRGSTVTLYRSRPAAAARYEALAAVTLAPG